MVTEPIPADTFRFRVSAAITRVSPWTVPFRVFTGYRTREVTAAVGREDWDENGHAERDGERDTTCGQDGISPQGRSGGSLSASLSAA
ncbi:hypothetical protein [Streptomyces pseudovenezuelae]|uniref:hypothetical protein n=1 Tax=Streptomyces pseudovenezuelae TaxID=67350 RepID=UPI002E802031|nr:hypothetical protein [Streptomyces pseudovenezuelae]WUA85921.1 hypothetical protein OHO81_00785 [Streptomyces pseudovenezuelae]